jgi:hypothetical protein
MCLCPKFLQTLRNQDRVVTPYDSELIFGNSTLMAISITKLWTFP